MQALKIIATIIIILYFALVVLLYVLQTRLMFFPGKLSKDFKFKLGDNGEEVFLTTADGERINALFYGGTREEVILYFHGNAGDLSGWQFIAEDFIKHGYNFFIMDYRGYGKSSGKISEQGLYLDANVAYDFLLQQKQFNPQDVIIYGRSVGTGVAVDLASRYPCKGLILEAPCTSFKKLADEKLPFFFPSLYIKFKFDNLGKINKVRSPAVFIHGTDDEIIPASHTEMLYKKFTGKKKKIIISNGSHNDLNAFREYHQFLKEDLAEFFNAINF